MSTRAETIAFIESDDFSINKHKIDIVLKRLLDLVHPSVVFTVGAEATNAIAVTIDLQDVLGNNLTSAKVITVWLSDTGGGADTAAVPSGGVAVSTGVEMSVPVAGKRVVVKTDATGQAVVDVTEATAKSFWLNVDINGEIFVAPVLAFA